MRFATAIVALVSAVAVRATNYSVEVGANGTLTYSPDSISGVQPGDIISFEFKAKNHTVTQSTFAAPCTNITNATTGLVTGIDSGFMFVPANATVFPQWSITIQNASAPLWFHCRQTNPASHCGNGMVFAINPTVNKTFDAFQTAAKATLNSTNTTSTTPGSNSTSTSSSTTPTHTGGAMKLTGSAAGLLTAVGLVAGLIL